MPHWCGRPFEHMNLVQLFTFSWIAAYTFIDFSRMCFRSSDNLHEPNSRPYLASSTQATLVSRMTSSVRPVEARSKVDADGHLRNIRASNGLDEIARVPQTIVKNLEAAAKV